MTLDLNHSTGLHPTHDKLLLSLVAFEQVLFEPATQSDLDGLRVLHEHWCEMLGDSPDAIAVCNALDDYIDACIADDGSHRLIEQAYLDLINCIHNSRLEPSYH